MPNGYLKHQEGLVGRKKARGGASRGKRSHCHEAGYCSTQERSLRRDITDEDFILKPKKVLEQTEPVVSKNTPSYPIGECPICLEEKPVIQMAGACSWHESACYECLRHVYVTDPERKFPLQCFHPQCQQPIRWGQLKKHKIIRSEEENQEHHRNMKDLKRTRQVSKEEKAAERLRVKYAKMVSNLKDLLSVECPHCTFPHLISRKAPLRCDRVLRCTKCHEKYLVSPNYPVIAALERPQQRDRFGGYQGVAPCPHCGILVSKGDGCSSMICGYCKRHFSWPKLVPHARIPPEQIYLWW